MRLKVLERDKFTCQCCYDTEQTLHVHHRYYVQGRDPWSYPMFSLVTLCVNCHKRPSDTDPSVKFQTGFYDWEGEIGALTEGSNSAEMRDVLRLLCTINAYANMRSVSTLTVLLGVDYSLKHSPSFLEDYITQVSTLEKILNEAVVS